MRYLIPKVNVPFFLSISGTIFLLTFLGIILYVYNTKRRKHFEQAAMLALEE